MGTLGGGGYIQKGKATFRGWVDSGRSYSQGAHFGGGDFEEFTVFCWSLPVLAQSSQDELCG